MPVTNGWLGGGSSSGGGDGGAQHFNGMTFCDKGVVHM